MSHPGEGPGTWQTSQRGASGPPGKLLCPWPLEPRLPVRTAASLPSRGAEGARLAGSCSALCSRGGRCPRGGPLSSWSDCGVQSGGAAGCKVGSEGNSGGWFTAVAPTWGEINAALQGVSRQAPEQEPGGVGPARGIDGDRSSRCRHGAGALCPPARELRPPEGRAVRRACSPCGARSSHPGPGSPSETPHWPPGGAGRAPHLRRGPLTWHPGSRGRACCVWLPLQAAGSRARPTSVRRAPGPWSPEGSLPVGPLI